MNIDRKLLLDIFRIPSMSGFEEDMAEFIKGKLYELNVPFEEDFEGNIFRLDGRKPFLNAHMDTVQSTDDTFLANLISIKEDTLLDGLGVIGGDDKCGIYIILRLLEKGYDFNFAFTTSEEIGTIGSRYLVRTEKDRLKECLYGITLDRKGNSDIICKLNDYGTAEFEKTLEEVGEEFGYKSVLGVLSDADEFSDCMSCANLSVGYYRAHSKKEYVILRDLERAEIFAEKIITNVTEKFEKPIKTRVGRGYRYSRSYPDVWHGGSYYGDYGYWDEEEEAFAYHSKEKGKTSTKHQKDFSEYDRYLDEEFDEYVDEYVDRFPDYSSDDGSGLLGYNHFCALCGVSDDLTYINSLREHYCPLCMIEIKEEVRKALESL